MTLKGMAFRRWAHRRSVEVESPCEGAKRTAGRPLARQAATRPRQRVSSEEEGDRMGATVRGPEAEWKAGGSCSGYAGPRDLRERARTIRVDGAAQRVLSCRTSCC